MKLLIKYFLFTIIISCSTNNNEYTDESPETNQPPSALFINITNITEDSAIATWTTATDPDGHQISYTIVINGNTIAQELTTTQYHFTNLNQKTDYFGFIKAIDEKGASSFTNYNFTTPQTSNTNTLTFNIPEELEDYYNITFYENGGLLYDELSTHIIGTHTNILSYFERHQYLYDADADLSNPDNVILMYSGEIRYEQEYGSNSNPYNPQTFNTEHVYPQSQIGNTAKTDLHHLRCCDSDINSDRSNYPFANSSGGYKLINGNSWYPGDEWKGDVARMIMYLNLRYNESFSQIGNLDLFLQWNEEDPVSPFEEQRNTVIYGAQGNRNPFIDNPYLATLIWGGNNAENKWE